MWARSAEISWLTLSVVRQRGVVLHLGTLGRGEGRRLDSKAQGLYRRMIFPAATSSTDRQRQEYWNLFGRVFANRLVWVRWQRVFKGIYSLTFRPIFLADLVSITEIMVPSVGKGFKSKLASLHIVSEAGWKRHCKKSL